uniref:zinc finger protein 24-like isoform X3 n=1 Tax=Solea senegalensis TaxID=28829 RepID=UPI001CD8587F|nr:zinc finger protein 24-like isoform X3 [Solea senegalensis]
MADTVVTFQSQLSGVMETVFKAAMYEITRLVEESFLEEVTRCREQVETLKRRLRWSECRRKEREGDRRPGLRCSDCGRVGVSDEERPRDTERSLKQESVLQEGISGSQGTEKETADHEVDESPGVQGENLDRLLKEEALHIPPETTESQERWGIHLDETDTAGVPGPSKRYSDQKIPKCQVNWEAGFEQRVQSEQQGHSGDPSEPLFQNRYSMEGLGDIDKTGYDDANMIEMGNLDQLQGSPSHLGEELNYMGHYEGDVEAPEGTEHQMYQTGGGSPVGSPSKTNIDVGGEFSCLLINEEGYLQDPSILYSGDSGGRFQGQGFQNDQSLDGTKDIYGVSDTYSDTLNLGGRLQHQAAGRGGRRHTCHQCCLSFPDSTSLKAHKQMHKGPGQGSPYSCTQCGKTFTQACNLKVHQRIHSGERPFCCSLCGRSFTKLSNLKAHRRVHTGERPYCCLACGKRFTQKCNLKRHQRIHLDV